jgi:hypothetical protein
MIIIQHLVIGEENIKHEGNLWLIHINDKIYFDSKNYFNYFKFLN